MTEVNQTIKRKQPEMNTCTIQEKDDEARTQIQGPGLKSCHNSRDPGCNYIYLFLSFTLSIVCNNVYLLLKFWQIH